MSTIDDIRAVERLMQTLDENPHLMEAVRSRIFTRELLELPRTVARLTELVDQIAGQLAQLTDRVDRLAERVDRLAERVDQIAEQLAQLTDRVDRLTERVDQIAAQLAQLTDRVDRLTERVDQIAEQLAEFAAKADRRLENLERLQDDIGVVKGLATDGLAQRVAPAIALTMNLRLTKNLSGEDLSAMLSGQDLSGVSHSQLESFLLADLIMETTDSDGRMLYVAVESSYTADERDTRRAIRNAGYLTRFTGAPARAAITAVRADWNIDDLIASGAVHWYKMPERLLQGGGNVVP